MKPVSFMPLVALLALPACAGSVSTASQSQVPNTAQEQVPLTNLPVKHAARPTVAAITPADLMTRLYIFADDSMGGRAAGTEWNLKGTQYIADEVRKLGLKPAGDNGSYFQDVHLFARSLDSAASSLSVGGKSYAVGVDFLPSNVPTYPREFTSAQAMYFGNQLDTVDMPSAAQLAGKVVFFGPISPNVKIATQEDQQKLIASHGYQEYVKLIQNAAAIAAVRPSFPPAAVAGVVRSQQPRVLLKGQQPGPWNLAVSPALAEAMLGVAPANATKGMLGKTVTANLKFRDASVPGRNVVAILEGSDSKLKNEYVVIGAHNDHIRGSRPVEHDSLRAYNSIARPGGAESQPKTPTAEQWARINTMKDSLRALHGGARMDSINNGADDDGSGSMGVLEIAEAFAKASTKPKRSLLFVWHTGEELGMFGSNYFTDNPTVPREQIVAALNVDMIGRGNEIDAPGLGGPQYLQLLGSRRLSTEYGNLVEQVIKDTNSGFKVDYQYDANGHPQQFYCRSDHWAYGRYGIPVTFFSTGGHQDYHMLTDEPQYIDYRHYARVTQLIHDVAVRVANLDHRLVIDGEKGDPYRNCVQ